MVGVSEHLKHDIAIKDLTYWVPDGNKGQRHILKGINGSFLAGHLTAILGPSGSGKTTLMNISAGYRTRRVSGTITVNSKPRHLSQFRRHSCYITQHDHLLPFLTVYEAMKAATALKLGAEKAATVGEQVIEEILQKLRLADCRNTRTHDLSGGETKRLSIALEMVNNPPVMFFDEPTSGLDSRNSYQCIQLLQTLARGGRTIVCTIHQPSARIFQMFDQVYGLSDGQCIFRGTTSELVPFLYSMGLECPPYHNPADFLVEVAVGEYGDLASRLAAEIKGKKIIQTNHDRSLDVVPELDPLLPASSGNVNESGLEKTIPSEEKGSHQPDKNEIPMGEVGQPCSKDGKLADTKIDIEANADQSLLDHSLPAGDADTSFPSTTWLQFSVLFRRTFLTIVRDMMLTKLRLGAHIVVALMIGLLYYGVGTEAGKVLDNSRCLFFVLLFFLFTAMMPTILTFPLEMNVLLREHLNRWYSLKSYYLAKTVADLPFQILFPVISVLIVYYLTAQPFEFWRLCLFTFFCILTSLVAQSIGLTIGAAFTVQEAVFLGPASVVPMLLFSGFFIQYSTIPVYMKWITYLSFVRYGFEGVVLSMYGFGREDLQCSEAFCYLKSPRKIMQSMDVSEEYIYLDVAMLVLYFVIVRVLGYFILRWKVKKNR